MICWVHGAFSSSRSFNYLKQFAPKNALMFEYSVNTPLESNIETLSRLLEQNPVDAIVGHSLGGVMAAIMVKRLGISKGVAISAPLRGFMIGNLFPFSQVLADTASWGPTICEIADHTFDDNFLSIVARQGNTASDGVVPVRSQLGAQGSRINYVDSNHFEVLLEPDVGQLIQKHLGC